MIVAAIYGLTMSVWQVTLGVVGSLEYHYGNSTFFNTNLLKGIKLFYFHNAQLKGNTVRIGNFITGLPASSYLNLYGTPHTTYRMLYYNYANIIIGTLYFVATVNLIMARYISFPRSLLSCACRPFVMITVTMLTYDGVFTVLFLNDLRLAGTLLSFADYIGADLYGTSGRDPTLMMIPGMTALMASKFVIFYILGIYITDRMIHALRTFGQNDIETGNANNVPAIEEGTPNSSENTSQASSVANCGTQTERNMTASCYGSYSNDAACSRSQLSPVKYSIQFPESLMSVTQRLENMLSKKPKVQEIPMTDNPRRSVQGSPPATRSQQTAIEMEPRGRRGTAIDLQNQLPWSYTPTSGNHMRDHLPPDEDLPPVPVPDYTVHSSFRKAFCCCPQSSINTDSDDEESNREDHSVQEMGLNNNVLSEIIEISNINSTLNTGNTDTDCGFLDCLYGNQQCFNGADTMFGGQETAI